MDIDLLKTFLEVYRTRHFGRTAENLYLTQSAVSARIRLLEETLGAPLFTRTRNDIQLTPAGTRMLKYAESILNAWNRARQDAALGEEDKVSLAIGASSSLWDILLQDWTHRLYGAMPRVALQAEAHGPELLIRKLLDRALDVAFMFEPPQMAELEVREVASIKLIMVADRPRLSAREAVGNGYIMADWGTSFAIAHARHFPDMPPPAVRMGLGRMALAFLLYNGGATYLAEQMVSEYLASGRLHRVDDAPIIDRQVYVVYPLASERKPLLEQVLSLLAPRQTATASARVVAPAL
ncbi:MAG: LysR family transcriptional regulator [Gammaproteobacteria bacterium]|nr:LysR family transcriptional regulator [Gammaproteobacteria bacterium]